MAQTEFYLVACFEAAAGAEPGAHLFSGGAGGGRLSGRGSCDRILSTDHVICMVLFKMWTLCAIEVLPAAFNVDLATASRSIAGAEDVLASTCILTTDQINTRELAEAPRGMALTHAGDAASVEWACVQLEGPADRGLGGGPARVRPGRQLQDAGRVRRGLHHPLQEPRAHGEGGGARPDTCGDTCRARPRGRLPGRRGRAGKQAR